MGGWMDRWLVGWLVGWLAVMFHFMEFSFLFLK